MSNTSNTNTVSKMGKSSNVIKNMSTIETFVRHDLNDKEDLVDDYMFHCGMSREEAEFASRNCLNEDLN